MEELNLLAERQVSFPSDFLWGVSTCAVHIEGRSGRGPCIWDAEAGAEAALAADQVNHLEEDLDLLRGLNVRAYRFSFAWTRLFPEGKGRVNAEGVGFYNRLVDGLLDRGIAPVATLLCDDLPLAFHRRGGWTYRDAARYFGDFAALCAETFADRVTFWITVEDPPRTALGGYGMGLRPPGLKDAKAAGAALHHLLLAHAEGLSALRELGPREIRVGITLSVLPARSAAAGPESERAQKGFTVLWNDATLDPLFRGAYPESLPECCPAFAPPCQKGDMERIAGELDFLGLRYFGPAWVRPHRSGAALPFTLVEAPERRSDIGWGIDPGGLLEALTLAWKHSGAKALFVTANGAAFRDTFSEKGTVNDTPRIEYLSNHVAVLKEALAQHIPLRGYFVWSLLDGFECEYGFGAPYGLVAVVRTEKFKRIPKESYRFISELFDRNDLPER